MTRSPPVAVIGGGLGGLSAAITIAEQGVPCTLFEAAPQLGGRTGSWWHAASGRWVDHGPHLLLGGYHHLLGLLARANAGDNIAWQDHLTLPLWSEDRGPFALRTPAWLPLHLALPSALIRLPGHDAWELHALTKLLRIRPLEHESVAQWTERLRCPDPLVRDLLVPLCLGSMNEHVDTANAASFAAVLHQAFSNHRNARLGWFRRSLRESMIKPLYSYARHLGVTVRTRTRIDRITAPQLIAGGNECGPFSSIVLAVPPATRNRLLDIEMPVETRAISNHHFWFAAPVALPFPRFVGGIGTRGEWFFDISAMSESDDGAVPRHYCVVISDADRHIPPEKERSIVLRELLHVCRAGDIRPIQTKTIRMRHATHPVRPYPPQQLPEGVIDACEEPRTGELPATMESAVMRGRRAALIALNHR